MLETVAARCRHDIFVAIAAFPRPISRTGQRPGPIAVSFTVTFRVPFAVTSTVTPAVTSVDKRFVTRGGALAWARSAQWPRRRSPRAAFLDDNSSHPEAGSHGISRPSFGQVRGHFSPQVSAES